MNILKKYICILLFSLPLVGSVSCGIRFEREREDNGTQQTAMLLTSGRQVKATMFDDSDIDIYQIHPGQRPFKGWQELLDQQQDVSLSVSLSHDRDIDLMIRVLRVNRTVKIIDDSPNFWETHGEEGIVNLHFPAQEIEEGRIFLQVEQVTRDNAIPYAGERNYTIRMNLSEAEEDEEREPNDKPVQATPVSQDLLARGYFDPAGNLLNTQDDGREADWFSFEIPDVGERQIVHISLTAVPNIDSRLSLYDELGYLIRTADSNDIGEMERLMSIGLVPGSYFIRIDTNGVAQKNMKVGYLLRIDLGDEENSEYEPNDRYIFANDVDFSSDLYGYFNPLEDIDWFQINVYEPEPQVLSIRISPTEDIDPVIELYGTGETLIRTANDRGVDEGEIIKNIGVDEGIYYIKVYNQNPERDNPERQYTLLIEKNPWQEDEEFEVNDFLEDANVIVFNGLKRGYVTPLGDRDVFMFTVEQAASAGAEADEAVEVTLELSPCVLLDIAMRIYDEYGVFIEEINNNPAEEGEKETLFLDPGRYYVEVMSMNQRENARDAYILRIY
jgi:hypothetical protein